MAAIKAARELAYPYTLTPDDNGAMLLSFPNIPEAVAVADDAQAVAANPPATASLGNGKDTAT